MFVTTTIAVVYWTVFVQGITIKPVVLYFRVKKKTEAEPCLTERITNRLMDSAKTAVEDILGDNSEIPIRFRNWYKVSTISLIMHSSSAKMRPLTFDFNINDSIYFISSVLSVDR